MMNAAIERTIKGRALSALMSQCRASIPSKNFDGAMKVIQELKKDEFSSIKEAVESLGFSVEIKDGSMIFLDRIDIDSGMHPDELVEAVEILAPFFDESKEYHGFVFWSLFDEFGRKDHCLRYVNFWAGELTKYVGSAQWFEDDEDDQ